MFAQAVLVIAMIFCGLLAIREPRLLYAALWLAATSALLAAELYWIGAPQIAVIELNAGAGLVTILLVLAIGSTERDSSRLPPALPRVPALALVAALVVLLLSLVSTPPPVRSAAPEASFAITFWEQRSADVLLQIALIFVGLLTVLGLLAETVKQPATVQSSAAAPTERLKEQPLAEPILEKDL